MKTPVALDRRSVLGLAAVALAEIASARIVAANEVECVAEGDNCNGSKVCCEGLTCETTGNEGEKECQSGTPPPECENDDDCPVGRVCFSGRCIQPNTPPCEVDSDCRPGEVCVRGSGICIVVTLTNTNNVFVPPAQFTLLPRRRKKRRKGRRRR
jgi:hypothetical protein